MRYGVCCAMSEVFTGLACHSLRVSMVGVSATAGVHTVDSSATPRTCSADLRETIAPSI